MKVELQCGDTIAIPNGCKAIVKDGSVVFEREEKFKDGDILAGTTRLGYHYPFIYKDTDERGFHKFYVGVNCVKEICLSDDVEKRWGNATLRYATDEEKQTLFDKMKEQGLRWNAEEKRVETIRWKAEEGKQYFCVDSQGSLMVYKEEGFCIDGNRYEFGNYFHTSDQVVEAAKRKKHCESTTRR